MNKANKGAFTSLNEAISRAEQLNKTRYRKSQIKVVVKQMSPYWVLVGVAK